MVQEGLQDRGSTFESLELMLSLVLKLSLLLRAPLAPMSLLVDIDPSASISKSCET